MSAPDLGKLLESFVSSAFRLECLKHYDVTEDDERAAFWRFRNERPTPECPHWWREDRPWCATVRKAVARGATMHRVRCVCGPLSDYEEFEFAWSYPYNEQAGEQIFVMNTGPGIFGDLRKYEHDFWLFDDATVVRLRYDDNGAFLGLESVEDAEPYRRARDFALTNATPFSQYRPAEPPERKRNRTDSLR